MLKPHYIQHEGCLFSTLNISFLAGVLQQLLSSLALGSKIQNSLSLSQILPQD